VCLTTVNNSRGNSVSIETRLRAGLPGFDSQEGWDFSLLPTASRPVLAPEVKRLGREAGHSPTSSTKVKNAWSYTSTPPAGLHGVVLN
jgi:hypothetical protein